MLTYQLLCAEQVADIYYNHMKQDFPPAEVKPLLLIQQLIKRGVYKPYGWYNETGDLIAYSFFVQAPGGSLLLMDYFAVCRAYRNSGYGSECLALMKALWQGTGGILAEVEDPAKSSSAEEEHTRTRRVAFYQRNGMRPTQVHSVLFGVPYILHYLPVAGECSDKQIYDELDAIYRTLFPLPVYKAKAKITLLESEAQDKK